MDSTVVLKRLSGFIILIISNIVFSFQAFSQSGEIVRGIVLEKNLTGKRSHYRCYTPLAECTKRYIFRRKRGILLIKSSTKPSINR